MTEQDQIAVMEQVPQDPEKASALFEEGLNILKADREKAVELFADAWAYDQDNLDQGFRYAYELDLLGEEEMAMDVYRDICSIQPAHVNALINLAVLYEDRGDYNDAEKCLKQILDTDPNHERASLFYKDVVASRGMYVDEDQQRMRDKQNSLLETPVTDFELSVRARNCLKKMNIRTLGDLLRTTEAELLAYKNFGETSLQEIKAMLSQKGLRLGQGLESGSMPPLNRPTAEELGVDEETMNTPVSSLELSVRSRKALSLLNINSVGDLISHTEAELLGIKNFGQTSLLEIREKLTERSLGLRKLEN